MDHVQKKDGAIQHFERIEQELTSLMVKICEEQYASSKDEQFHKANALAKSSLAVIESIKTFAAIAAFPEDI